MSDLQQFLDESRGRFEEELCELLRIPSVSADSTLRSEMRRAAQWLQAQLQKLGLPPRSSRQPDLPWSTRNRRPYPVLQPCWCTATTTSSRPIR